MGRGGRTKVKEDELAALYIQSLLQNDEMKDIEEQARSLQYDGGQHFFASELQQIFPQKDFWMCIDYNRFSFVLKVVKDNGIYMKKNEA